MLVSVLEVANVGTFTLLILCIFGCTAPELTEAERFLADQSHRRTVLADSLVDPSNGYSSLRLDNYGVDNGWDDLLVYNPETRPLFRGDLGELQDGEFARVFSPTDLSDAELIELGRRAFESFPLGERYELTVPAESEAQAERFGVWIDNQDRVGGIVRVRREDGTEGFAPTCSTCHGRTDEDGHLIAGATNTHLRQDEMIAERHGYEPETRWGSGRVDPTGDGVDNPSVITDLRPIRHQSLLNWGASIHNSLQALAIRVETLFITSYGQRVRPPREVAYAIAVYLYSLGEGGSPGDATLEPEGAEIFERECSSCHGADGSSRGAIALEVIGTEPSVGRSSMRGTGRYRIPSLYGVADRSRLMHDGELTSLEDMFDPNRLTSIPGHVFGTQLSELEREQLLGFVRTIGN